MSVNTADAQNAAQMASELTNIPSAFALALIQEEGTMSQSNNPFDITQTWASDTGFLSYVTGLWNSVGVAIFSGWQPAVQSWSQGINEFSNYAQFRADLNAGKSARTLATDLAKAGYSGGDITNFVNNVSALYEQNSGLSADAPLQGGGTPATTPPPSGGDNSGSSGSSAPPSNPDALSFTNGLLHIGISIGLIIVAIVLMYFGIQLIMGHEISKNAPIITEAAETV